MKREQERKDWESKCQELQTKNEKLMKQVTSQSSVQGEKHIIWDAIIAEASKLRPYLDYILDKEVVIQSSKQSTPTVIEILNKKPIDYAKNFIDFLNGLTEDELKTENIKDIISIISCAKKGVNKHQHLDTTQYKIGMVVH